MFGIDFDKLLLVGILVGLIVGPARLREWRRSLPQLVGRVHALYQQGRADVTRNLDDLAPDWREYDPRELHPRRILRGLGEDVRRAAQGPDARAGSETRMGEPPVETPPQPLDEEGRGHTAGAGGDDAARPLRDQEPAGDVDPSGSPRREGDRGVVVTAPEGSPGHPGRRDQQHGQREAPSSPVGGGERKRAHAEEHLDGPVGLVQQKRDDAKRDETAGGGESGRDGRIGSSGSERLGGDEHTSE